MRSPEFIAMRLIALFGSLGLLSALLMSRLRTPVREDADFASGAIYGVFLCGGFLFAHRSKWVSGRLEWWRLAGTILWLAVTYIAAVVVFITILGTFDKLLKPIEEFGAVLFILALAVTGCASSAAVSAALFFLTGVWDRRAFVLFLLIGIVAGPLVLLTMKLGGERFLYPTFYFITEGLAGLASGYWFFRTSFSRPTMA